MITMPSSQTAPEDARPLVLIVDDDGAVRDSLSAGMEAFGFRTCTASNGVEGLQAMEIELPSAIVTDLHMPDMDGFELLSALRASKAGIPVIAMSGGVTRGYDFLKAAMHLGAVAAFQKPFQLTEMVDAIHGVTA